MSEPSFPSGVVLPLSHLDPEVEDLKAQGLDPNDYAVLLQPAAGLQLDAVMVPGVGPAVQVVAFLVVPESVLRIPQSGMLDAAGRPVPSPEARGAIPNIPPVVRLCVKRTVLTPAVRANLDGQARAPDPEIPVSSGLLDLGKLT